MKDDGKKNSASGLSRRDFFNRSALVAAGVDDGREMPDFKDVVWTLNRKGSETILD